MTEVEGEGVWRVGDVMWGGAGEEVGRTTLFSLSSCITSLTTSPRLEWTENCERDGGPN